MKRSVCYVISFILALCLAIVPLAANAAVWGDVTGEGQITTSDARLALRAAIGLERYAPGSAQFAGADIIADGKITTDDARLILRIAVGLEPKENQYDILRSGAFYMEGRTDGENGAPMKMAVNKDLVYMEMNSGDMELGYLVKNKSIYLLNPAEKTYHKLNAIETATMKGFGLMDEKEIRAEIAEFGFDSMPSLNTADSVSGGKLNGMPCAVYTYRLSDGGRTEIYMYGYRLLAMNSVSADGKTASMMTFTNVSGAVPTYPPAGYKSVTLIKLVEGLAGE